jgi:hypothetical protein
LDPWKESATQHGGMATSFRGETAPGREKGGDDCNWADVNLTELKNKENLRG